MSNMGPCCREINEAAARQAHLLQENAGDELKTVTQRGFAMQSNFLRCRSAKDFVVCVCLAKREIWLTLGAHPRLIGELAPSLLLVGPMHAAGAKAVKVRASGCFCTGEEQHVPQRQQRQDGGAEGDTSQP